MNKTNKILWFVAALLLILNLATIGTIIYHNKLHKDDELTIVLDEKQQNPLTGRFLRRELGFNNEQMDVFRQANRTFHIVANNLLYEMDSLKVEMFEELNKETPDTVKLQALSKHIGMHHVELKDITNQYYLKLKSVCDQEQCEQLQEAFQPLFRDGTVNIGRGYGRGYGRDTTDCDQGRGQGQGRGYGYGRGRRFQ